MPCRCQGVLSFSLVLSSPLPPLPPFLFPPTACQFTYVRIARDIYATLMYNVPQVFCNHHRAYEQHECTVNHAMLARAQLTQQVLCVCQCVNIL